MLFCEDCRLKRKWPKPASYPYSGVRQDVTCEICNGRHLNCFDIPAMKLIPDGEKNLSERTLDKLMQQSYQNMAESLMISYADGRTDYKRTEELKKVFVNKNGAPDWFETYRVRVALQEQIQRSRRE
jgi:hypothetical protein